MADPALAYRIGSVSPPYAAFTAVRTRPMAPPPGRVGDEPGRSTRLRAVPPLPEAPDERGDPAPQPEYRVRLFRQPESRWLGAMLPVYLVMAVVYLGWRTAIVNWTVWYGPVVFAAEVYGAFMTVLFLLITRRIYLPRHRPISRKAEVDAFIPTFHEPLEVLRPTVIGALRVRGISRVFVLDDGNRPEVRAMAARLGCGYLARPKHEHAKAGNLNYALPHSTAEFILNLDADHVPVPEFLERTLGYFDDQRLGFVQTPQSFSNLDSFLFRRRRNGRLWSEQGMFYDVIQPAKNRWNSAFFVGTSAVMRRAALDSVGGFATGTATEDVHTSLRLHAKGWTSLYVPERLAFGLEAENMKEFYRQRMRWAAGSLGLLFRSPDSPLRARGLSMGQRLNYLSSTLAHVQGVQRLIYFLLPVACIFELQSPVNTLTPTFLPAFAAFIAVSLLFTSRHARGTYHPVFTESYNLVNAAAHLAGIRGVFRIERRFSVSRKSGARTDVTWTRTAMWLLLALSAAALVRAALVLAEPRSALGVGGWVAAASVPFLLANVAHLLSFVRCLVRYERGHQPSVPEPAKRSTSVSEPLPAPSVPARLAPAAT